MVPMRNQIPVNFTYSDMFLRFINASARGMVVPYPSAIALQILDALTKVFELKTSQAVG